jgi:hypothetical protein
MRPGTRVVAKRQIPYQLAWMRRKDELLAIHPGDLGEVIKPVPGVGHWVRFPERTTILCDKGTIKRDRRPAPGQVRP